MPKVIINGTRLYYEEHGSGEPLILIQGFAGGSNAWFRQVPVLEKHFRVITFDARGLDKSDVSKVPYTLPVMEEDIVCLMDHLKVREAHILGTSLGGLVAQAVAIGHPERVLKLVLVSTFSGTDILLTSPHLKEIYDVSRNLDAGSMMAQFIALAFNKRFYRDMINFLSILRRNYAYNDYFKQMQLVGEYSTTDRLKLIRAPTMVITGSADNIVPPENSIILSEKIPHAKLVVVSGGSHAFFLEMSSRFNREVQRFLG